MLPGHSCFSVMSILPLDHETTSFAGHRYGLDADPNIDLQLQYVNNILAPEDVALCESVQKGLKSQSYDQGRFIVDPEAGTRNC